MPYNLPSLEIAPTTLVPFFSPFYISAFCFLYAFLSLFSSFKGVFFLYAGKRRFNLVAEVCNSVQQFTLFTICSRL